MYRIVSDFIYLTFTGDIQDTQDASVGREKEN